MQTRSKSGIVKKKVFAASTTIDYLQTEPPIFTIASKIPEWRAAMASEFDALQRQHTWSLVPPCSDQNLVRAVGFTRSNRMLMDPWLGTKLDSSPRGFIRKLELISTRLSVP
jgi:hypothetical protein